MAAQAATLSLIRWASSVPVLTRDVDELTGTPPLTLQCSIVAMCRT